MELNFNILYNIINYIDLSTYYKLLLINNEFNNYLLYNKYILKKLYTKYVCEHNIIYDYYVKNKKSKNNKNLLNRQVESYQITSSKNILYLKNKKNSESCNEENNMKDYMNLIKLNFIINNRFNNFINYNNDVKKYLKNAKKSLEYFSYCLNKNYINDKEIILNDNSNYNIGNYENDITENILREIFFMENNNCGNIIEIFNKNMVDFIDNNYIFITNMEKYINYSYNNYLTNNSQCQFYNGILYKNILLLLIINSKIWLNPHLSKNIIYKIITVIFDIDIEILLKLEQSHFTYNCINNNTIISSYNNYSNLNENIHKYNNQYKCIYTLCILLNHINLNNNIELLKKLIDINYLQNVFKFNKLMINDKFIIHNNNNNNIFYLLNFLYSLYICINKNEKLDDYIIDNILDIIIKVFYESKITIKSYTSNINLLSEEEKYVVKQCNKIKKSNLSQSYDNKYTINNILLIISINCLYKINDYEKRKKIINIINDIFNNILTYSNYKNLIVLFNNIFLYLLSININKVNINYSIDKYINDTIIQKLIEKIYCNSILLKKNNKSQLKNLIKKYKFKFNSMFLLYSQYDNLYLRITYGYIILNLSNIMPVNIIKEKIIEKIINEEFNINLIELIRDLIKENDNLYIKYY
jgi:hypothetical protein